ncbi:MULTISPECIES: amino acid ABC transporter permease [unclassified Microbacterium]|uniref:amino acid ABC transporter permease n=1 Tax=unclassified Microbacterium TaxID=2609290 RepID=UPI00301A7742
MLLVEYFPDFAYGFWLTASVSLLAFLLACVLGVLGALAALSRSRTLRAISRTYVEVVRNIPLLVVVYVFFFGLPSIGLTLPGYVAGLLALAVNTGAYMVTIIRTGIVSVSKGQREAARTLGLSRSATFFDVVAPQAARAVYPPMVNEFLQLILHSSILSVIAVNELTGVALILNGRTFQTMEAFGTALVLYLILTNAIAFAADRLGKAVFKAPLNRPRRTVREGLGRLVLPMGGRS